MKAFRSRALMVRIGTVIAVVLAVLLTTQTVLAYIEEVIAGPFRVGLVSWEQNAPNDGQSTWVYEVSIDTSNPPSNALSHWVLGTTCPPVSMESQGAAYGIEFGTDRSIDTRTVYGAKWEYISGGALGGSGPMTHTFTIVVDSLNSAQIPVDVKYGSFDARAEITGPYCAPTSVDLASLGGSSGTQMPVLLTALALGATVVSTRVLRKDDGTD